MSSPSRDTIRNPLTTEEVTFVRTACESNGEQGIVEILIGPRAKGPPLHYHAAFTETFEVLEGELTLRIGRSTRRLGEGERQSVRPRQHHTFWSECDRPSRFRGIIEPASPDLENCFRIAFGLARDGLVRASGVPKRLSHVAILTTMSQSSLCGPASALNPLLGLLARTRACSRTRDELVRRYCGPPGDAPSPGVGVSSPAAEAASRSRAS